MTNFDRWVAREGDGYFEVATPSGVFRTDDDGASWRTECPDCEGRGYDVHGLRSGHRAELPPCDGCNGHQHVWIEGDSVDQLIDFYARHQDRKTRPHVIECPARGWKAERREDGRYTLHFLSAPVSVSRTFVLAQANGFWWEGLSVIFDGTPYPGMGSWGSIAGGSNA